MLDRLLAILLQVQEALRGTPAFQWGVIKSTSPLTVQLDGDDAPLTGPSTLVSGLAVNNRVLVLIQHNRVTIIGRGGG